LSFDEFPQSVDTLARTIWGEARGCGASGMGHVANVIINRIDSPRWWGDDVISVCRAPRQFSCWNADDPNYDKLLAATTANTEFAVAVALSLRAVGRKLPDETGGADSYYATSMRQPPAWAKRAEKTFSDGWHTFLRVELPAPSGGPDAAPVSVHAPPDEDVADLLDDEYNPGS
jgi:spore germination cell wall hydrolase CwlJ-like protein